MKQIILIYLCLYVFAFQANALFWSENGWDMYKNINSKYTQLKLAQFEYELSWQWDSISSTLNDALEHNGIERCIKDNINSYHVQQIAEENKIDVLEKYIVEDCKTEKNIDIQILTSIQQIIKEIYKNTKQRSKTKSENIIWIANTWIYTDGSIDNSPFDLIKDLQEIDKIIFWEEIEYEWVAIDDESTLWLLYNDLKKIFNPEENEDKQIPENKNEANQNDEKTKENTQNSLNENYICSADLNNKTNLNEEIINNILADIKSGNTGSKNWDTNIKQSIEAKNRDEKKANFWDYQKVNDPWPCTEMFCITTELIIYEHKVLWWWQYMGIADLIDRSNKHLKKFMWASLTPKKMTTNNFEIWFSKFSFSEMFHQVIQFIPKPVPILDNIENKENTQDPEKENIFAHSKLLKKYYKNNNLDFNRKNDIKLFTHTLNELKSVTMSENLDNQYLIKRNDDFNEYLQEWNKKTKLQSKSIRELSSSRDLEMFTKQFMELQWFTNALKQYSNSLYNSINAIHKKP